MPTICDYNAKVQNPDLNFADAELQSAEVVRVPGRVTLLQSSGRFAAIYRLKSINGKHYAIKCFTTYTTELDARYAAIGDDLGRAQPINSETGRSYTVHFDYQRKGILIDDQWQPILKMEWVDGERLDDYIQRCIGDASKMSRLANKWHSMSTSLRRLGIAHGDLHPENVFVVDNELSLVDYDDMFVPALATHKPRALGLPNFQHPKRTEAHFGPYLDNFSDWVMYTSLVALSIDPTLLSAQSGDQHLVFKQRDFIDPDNSLMFNQLVDHPCAYLAQLATSLKNVTRYPVEFVPVLEPTRAIRPVLAVTRQDFTAAAVATSPSTAALGSQQSTRQAPPTTERPATMPIEYAKAVNAIPTNSGKTGNTQISAKMCAALVTTLILFLVSWIVAFCGIAHVIQIAMQSPQFTQNLVTPPTG